MDDSRKSSYLNRAALRLESERKQRSSGLAKLLVTSVTLIFSFLRALPASVLSN